MTTMTITPEQAAISALERIKKTLDARLVIATERRESIDRVFQSVAGQLDRVSRLAFRRVNRLSDALSTANRLVESIGDRVDKVALAISSVEDLPAVRSQSLRAGRAIRKLNRAQRDA